jgi:peptide/nickel transport system permease protein
VGNIAAVCFVFLVVLSIGIGPWLAPFSPVAFDPAHALSPPDATFLFGTDEFGRDVFSRVLCGARPTLVLALVSAAVGVVLGTTTGLVAGYAGTAVDETLMRLMDALMSFPALILAMLVVVMLGTNPVNVVVALAVVFWPRSARLVRSVVIELARREFVEAARARGESWPYILFRELLPNVRMIIAVDFSLRVTYGVLLSASLAYLGIGVAAPTPAWGLMVRDGQQFLEIAPWLVIFPCAAVALTATGMLLAGERLRRYASLPGGERPR